MRGRIWTLASLLAMFLGGTVVLLRVPERELQQAQPRAMDRRCRGGCASGALLSILPRGPTAAQIAAGTLSATNGTAVTWSRASSGYVETGAVFDSTQLLAYPDKIDSTLWFPSSGVTLTNAYGTGPGGTSGATALSDRLVFTSGGSQFARTLTQPVSPAAAGLTSWSGQTVTIGAWVKATSGTAAFAFRLSWTSVTDRASGDLNATTDWQFFTFSTTYPTNAAVTSLDPGFALASTLAGYDIQVAGVKLQVGSSTAFVRPMLVQLGSNLPRVGPLGVLVETTTTNLVLYSQALSNAAWTHRGTGTATDNVAIAPDGTLTASSLTVNGNGNDVYQVTSGGTNNATSSPSFYIKPVSTSGTLSLWNPEGPPDGQWNIDLSVLPTGTWTRITSTHPAVTVVNTFVNNGSGNGGIQFLATAGAPLSAYVWGVQYEKGSYASSYIPTTSASATRAADIGSTANPLTSMATFQIGATITPYSSFNDGKFHIIAGFGTTSLNGDVLLSSGNLLGVATTDDASHFVTTSPQPAISDGITVVAGAKAGPNSLLYSINGTVTTPTTTGGPAGVTTPRSYFFLGNNSLNAQLNGWMSDIAVWSKVSLP